MEEKKPEEGVEDFSKGPLSVLWHSVKNNTQVRCVRGLLLLCMCVSVWDGGGEGEGPRP